MQSLGPPGVSIVEVSPRDGLQNEPNRLDTGTKLALIERLVAHGARRVEVTAFVRSDVVPALADATELVAALSLPGSVEMSALVANLRGYERAVGAGLRAVNMVVLATDTFSLRNQGRATRVVLDQMEEIRGRCLTDGVRLTVTVGAAFGCPFEGEVGKVSLTSVLSRVAEIGVDEIALADTIGVAAPSDVTERFALLADLAPGVPTRAHFHDTRNTGVANAVAAVASGVGALDSSLAGIGGCPFAPAAAGNVATEDLVYCLERMGIDTGFDLTALLDDARWLSRCLDREPSSALARAGAFPTDQWRSSRELLAAGGAR